MEAEPRDRGLGDTQGTMQVQLHATAPSTLTQHYPVSLFRLALFFPLRVNPTGEPSKLVPDEGEQVESDAPGPNTFAVLYTNIDWSLSIQF